MLRWGLRRPRRQAAPGWTSNFVAPGITAQISLRAQPSRPWYSPSPRNLPRLQLGVAMSGRPLTGLILAGVAGLAAATGCDDSETSTGSVAGSGGTMDGGAGDTGGVATGGTGGQDDPCSGKACGEWCSPTGYCDDQGECSPVFAEANAALMRGEGASGAGGETQTSCPGETPEEGTACPTEGEWCYYVATGCPPDSSLRTILLCLCGRWIDSGAHCEP